MLDKKLEEGLREHGISEDTIKILKEHKPIEDGHIYTLDGLYHFFARIRDKNMVRIPDELIREMQVENDDLVNITIQRV